MSTARSFRRASGLAFAVLFPLVSLVPIGCASGGSGDTEDSGSLGDFDGTEPMTDTGPRPDGTAAMDTSPPPFDGGVDTGMTHPDSGGTESGGDTSKPPKDSGPKDTGPADTGTCVTVTVSSSGGKPVSCTPEGTACGDLTDVSAFTPSWIPPNAASTTACKTAQITAIYNDCYGPSSTAAKCTSIQSTDKACYDCAVTAEGSASYGAVISSENQGLVFLNQAGCIDLLEPCNLACAEAFQGAFQCEEAACEGNCPTITTAAMDTSYQDCIGAAATCDPMGCDTYYTEYSNCGTLLTGATHPGSVCVGTSTSTFETLFKAIVPVFCGP